MSSCHGLVPAAVALVLAGCGLRRPIDPWLDRPVPAAAAAWTAAREALGHNDAEAAIPRLRSVIATSPRLVKAHLLYQDAMIARGAEAAVQAEYARRQGRSGLDLALYARIAPEEKRIPLLEQAVDREPDNPWIHYALGFERLIQSQDEEAGRHLQRALELDPDLPGAHVAMALLDNRRVEPERAAHEYERYLEVCKLDALRWLKLGIYRHAAGDDEGAMKAYLAVLAIKREELQEAIRKHDVVLTAEQLRRYEEPCSLGYAARVNLSDLLMKRGDYTRVVDLLEEAVNENPRCPDAHFNLGIAFEKLSLASREDREPNHFAEQAHHHWKRYLALGGRQQERVKSWLEALRNRNPDPFGGRKP